MTFGDSSHLSIGDGVTVLGNALGRGGPPVSTRGRITALDQTITASDPGGVNAETLSQGSPGPLGARYWSSAGESRARRGSESKSVDLETSR